MSRMKSKQKSCENCDDSFLWTNYKWLLVLVFLSGCTMIYINGDGNEVDSDFSGTDIHTDTDTDIEESTSEPARRPDKDK